MTWNNFLFQGAGSCNWLTTYILTSILTMRSPSPVGRYMYISLLELLSYHPNMCIVPYQTTNKHLKNLEWCWRQNRLCLKMCLFSFRFFFPSAFCHHLFFPIFAVVFSLGSCRAGMNLNQTFISAPGTVIQLLCIYAQQALFTHIFWT